ncbi:hypothetical protein FHS18_001926 [Paenibacillus phyllosphaerae]|uniref:Uncharacterized protein n=1 Tax=Paenibacillus phyllosphaerae TaxID=274593 RepID=A0A7W5AW19_9BACL|nr:hypothetical protein [Paenibacillus phyllosphaerae]MBB3109863.1 hypothetical protein [Paenibacillus phyllosphaerae]
MSESLRVQNVHLTRETERNGTRCVEAEVSTEAFGPRGLLAYFANSEEQDYEMIAVLHRDASLDTDWYDNSAHNAYADVSFELFENVEMKIDWSARDLFKEQVLAFPGVRDGIARLL